MPNQPTKPSVFVFLAVATGIAVASIYLNQVILSPLARAFDISADRIGIVSSVTQLGYAGGLFFLVPLGDVIAKRTLILAKIVFLSLAILCAGVAQNWEELILSSAFIGFFASVTQSFVPLAADLAEPSERGKKIGVVMSGLLMGILLSRTLSGVIESAFGWRWVFLGFFFIVAALIAPVWMLVPSSSARTDRPGYAQLLRRVIRLALTERPLQVAMVRHGFVGMAFSAFWTNLSLYLSGPVFGYRSNVIGAFALIGAIGILAAPVAGRMSDARGPAFGIRLGISANLISFLLMLLFPKSLPVLVTTMILFDAGTQVSLISHQTIIYAINPQMRSSLNSVFMTFLFLCFALGSAISNRMFGTFGWPGVLGFALTTTVLALAMSFVRVRNTNIQK